MGRNQRYSAGELAEGVPPIAAGRQFTPPKRSISATSVEDFTCDHRCRFVGLVPAPLIQ